MSNSSSVFIPSPRLGIDWSVPVSEVAREYSPFMMDWIANGITAEMRSPDTLLIDQTNQISCIAPYTAGDDIVYTESGTPFLSKRLSDGATIASPGPSWSDYVEYQGLLFLTASAGAYSYNGTALSLAFSKAASSSAVDACCVYNNRYIQSGDLSLWYGGVGFVSGALTQFNIASLCSGGYITAVRSVSSSNDLNVQDFLVVTTSVGDVLFFTGDFPGSANWALSARVKLPVVAGFRCWASKLIGGDVYIYTQKPVRAISATALFRGNLEAADSASVLSLALPRLLSSDATLYGIHEHPSFGGIVLTLKDGSSPGSSEAVFDTYYGHSAPPSGSSYLLYYDRESGALSPISAYAYASPRITEVGTTNPYSTAIAAPDGYFTYVYQDGTNWRLVRCMDKSAAQDPDSDILAILAFPYSPLSSGDTGKTISAIYPIVGSPKRTGTNDVEDLRLSIGFDFDFLQSDGLTLHKTNTLKYSTSKRLYQRCKMPVAGQGNYVSPVVLNSLQPQFAINGMFVQYAQGGKR